MKVLRCTWPEAHELGVLEPGDACGARAAARATSARLWKPTRLKWVRARFSWRSCTTAYGRRPVGRGEPDRLHRAEAQRVDAAPRHLLDRQAALEVERLLEVVQRQHLGGDERGDERLVLLARRAARSGSRRRRPCRSARPKTRRREVERSRRRRSARWRRRSRGSSAPRSALQRGGERRRGERARWRAPTGPGPDGTSGTSSRRTSTCGCARAAR